MSSVKIVPATIEHLVLVPDLPMGSKDDLLKGPAFALFINDELLGVGGVQVIWNGVGEAWLFVNQAAWKFKRRVFVSIRNCLEKIIKEGYFHRVQALVLDGHKEGERFIKHLGFEHEGLMKHYGQNCETFNRYARLD